MKIKPLLLLPPLLFGGFLIFAFLGLGGEKTYNGRVGAIAPAIFTTEISGFAPLNHAELLAPGVKIVNFWASWCTPCRAEHPNLELLSREGIAVYGVNYKDHPEDARAFLTELGNPYAAVGGDPNARTALEWGVAGVPETYVLDGQGRIILRFAGPITERSLNAVIRPALIAAATE